jgi:hypothetical protein
MEVVIGFVRYVFAMNIEHTVTAENLPDTIQNELAILFSHRRACESCVDLSGISKMQTGPTTIHYDECGRERFEVDVANNRMLEFVAC